MRLPIVLTVDRVELDHYGNTLIHAAGREDMLFGYENDLTLVLTPDIRPPHPGDRIEIDPIITDVRSSR